jgi:thioredoxin reductase
MFDAVIIGGGPAGLSAALALGRACKRVLLCDAGARRNAAAEHIHNFVTRDGTPPNEFRRLARAELAAYPNVEFAEARVESISGTRGAFQLALSSGTIEARRVLLCTGMVDEMLPIEGFQELWGRSIFQCPYCHGWEVKERRWGYLARSADFLPFGLFLRGWARDVAVFTNGAFEVPSQVQAELEAASVALETRPIAKLSSRDGELAAVEFVEGAPVPCEALFVHPPQKQVELVRILGLLLDQDGFVQVDPMTRGTSIAGISAAGDLTTRMQGATFAAAQGVQAAAMLNHELTMELALSGALGH